MSGAMRRRILTYEQPLKLLKLPSFLRLKKRQIRRQHS
jgi:hypothetical protein